MTSEGSKFGNINSQPSCNRELQSMASALPGDEETPLVGDISGLEGRKSHHTRDVHILSLAFLLVFLAFGAAQNLQSTLNTVSLSVSLSLCVLILYSVLLLVFEFDFRRMTWVPPHLGSCICLSHSSPWLLLWWCEFSAPRTLCLLGLLDMCFM